METKTFEIRAAATFIPVMAVKLRPACEQDRYLLARAGFGLTSTEQGWYVLLIELLCSTRAQYDPWKWNDRTFKAAHQYIHEHWNELESGAVVDVEFILGETDKPKESESRIGLGEE